MRTTSQGTLLTTEQRDTLDTIVEQLREMTDNPSEGFVVRGDYQLLVVADCPSCALHAIIKDVVARGEPFDRTKWPINDVAIQVVEDRRRPVIRRKLELYRARDLIDVLITEIEEGLWGRDDDDDDDADEETDDER